MTTKAQIEAFERARERAKKRGNRFPTPVRDLRERFPNGTLVRAQFTTAGGQTVTHEGPLDAEFLKIARAILDAAGAN